MPPLALAALMCEESTCVRLHRRQVLLAASVSCAYAVSPPRHAEAGEGRIVLGRFTTLYEHDAEHKSRAFNVQLAAEAIDGKSIAPGATLSFNDAVGERTAAFGYAKAIVLRDGMIAEGVGGGACQVASTLHAAALLAGLEIVARSPHSRPSAYIRMGLDATVAFPKIDLKVKNAGADAVVVHARAAKGSLEVWIDTAGTSRPTVTVRSEIVERTPFARVFERDRSIHDDKAHRKTFGIPGYRVRRTREIQAADGTVRRDVRFDVYPPTNELLRVSPAFDESQAGDGDDDDASTDEPRTPRLTIVVDAAATPPVLVQLRPSTVVTIDNAAP
jgi:VanW like protein